MKKLAVLFVFLLAVSVSRIAHADSFAFTFNSLDYSGAGTFTAQLQSSNQYLIGGISGSVSNGPALTTVSQAITALIPPDPSVKHFEDNDNLLFFPSTTGFFDFQGVSFVLADGTMINLSYASGYTIFFQTTSQSQASSDAAIVTVTSLGGTTPVPVPAAATPEPSALILLGTGALSLTGVVRRRFVA